MDFYTRFGPTAMMSLRLEKNILNFKEFYKVLNFDWDVAKVLFNICTDKDMLSFMLKNFMYESPLIGKIFFLKEVRKIIPSLAFNDLSYAKEFGGIRPQLIDKRDNSLCLDEASIYTKDGILFNMIPSPGATSCLSKAYIDAQKIVKFLDKSINNDQIKQELLQRE
jgi:malate dehydrogenase (quinone)